MSILPITIPKTDEVLENKEDLNMLIEVMENLTKRRRRREEEGRLFRDEIPDRRAN